MAVALADLQSPLGPLRRDTFRDTTDADFQARVSRLLERAQAVVAAKVTDVTDVTVNTDRAVEPLALSLAYEQAASIWSALPQEEAVAGEVSLKYLSPVELRLEAERYGARYSVVLASLLDTTGATPARVGRLRRV